MFRTAIVCLLATVMATLTGCTIMLDSTPCSRTPNAFNQPSSASVAPTSEEPIAPASEIPATTNDSNAAADPTPTATPRMPNLRAVRPQLSAVTPGASSNARTPNRELPNLKRPDTRIHLRPEVTKPPPRRDVPKPKPRFDPPRPDTRLVQRSK